MYGNAGAPERIGGMLCIGGMPEDRLSGMERLAGIDEIAHGNFKLVGGMAGYIAQIGVANEGGLLGGRLHHRS